MARSVLVATANLIVRRTLASSLTRNRSPGPTFSLAGKHTATTSTSDQVVVTRSLSRSPSRVRGRCRPGVSIEHQLRVGPVHDAPDDGAGGLRPRRRDRDLACRPARWSAWTCRRWGARRRTRSRCGTQARPDCVIPRRHRRPSGPVPRPVWSAAYPGEVSQVMSRNWHSPWGTSHGECQFPASPGKPAGRGTGRPRRRPPSQPSQVGRSGKCASPSASGLTASTWCSWISLRSKPTAASRPCRGPTPSRCPRRPPRRTRPSCRPGCAHQPLRVSA